MRVAVTGSNGLLGSALCASLLADGHRVVKFVRHAPQAIDERRWNPDAGRIDAPGLDDVDAVVNLAGAPIGTRWTTDAKATIRRSRLAGTLTIVAALTPDGRCQRMLNASAIGYYGDTGPQIVDEHSAAGTGFLATVTRDWETSARHCAVPLALLRTGQVLSPAGGILPKLLPFFRAGAGGRIGNARQFFSWISLNDHVRAMRFLLESDITGPVNLTAPNPVTNAEFTHALGAAVHRLAVVPMPLPAVRLLFGRDFVAETLLASSRALPARLLDAGFTFQQPQVGMALAGL